MAIRYTPGASYSRLIFKHFINIPQLPILAAGNILNELKTRNGFPELDAYFQTSVPGLVITSMRATQLFGFFGFTVAVRAAAQLICEELARS